MALSDFLPIQQSPPEEPIERRAVVLDTGSGNSSVVRLFKALSLALGFENSIFGNRTKFESSPYDFDRIIQAADTDSYVRQAFNKYKELLWKQGWDIVGENTEAVDYLLQRLDYMEFAMRRPFDDLLIDIGDQLVKFGNAFLVKSRGNLNPYFPTQLRGAGGQEPLVGYYLVPAETMEIKRDKHNRVLQYRQNVDNIVSSFTQRTQPTWRPDEVIHFAVDKKPGRAFGTPFLVAVIDDIIALRQLEEDIQNLVHKELFPLYKYKVGTEDFPAEDGEIEAAADELAGLRTEGGLVLPERHDVDVIGADGNALDASPYLQHFMQRVCAGLGLSPHHLGIMMNGGNRSVTDRLDIALYDKVKTYQRYLSDMIRLHIFTELLLEGGFDPITNPLVSGRSDRCTFRFHEIDVDSMVKIENHEINKFANNIQDLEETRMALNLPPEVDEGNLLAALTARLQPIQQKSPDGAMTTQVPEKPNTQAPSTGGRANPKNTRRGPGNRSQPANQYGRRSSPNIRHSEEYLADIVELIDDEDDIV